MIVRNPGCSVLHHQSVFHSGCIKLHYCLLVPSLVLLGAVDTQQYSTSGARNRGLIGRDGDSVTWHVSFLWRVRYIHIHVVWTYCVSARSLTRRRTVERLRDQTLSYSPFNSPGHRDTCLESLGHLFPISLCLCMSGCWEVKN